MIRIAIDANGGDYGLETTVPAAMMAGAKFPTLEIISKQVNSIPSITNYSPIKSKAN